MKTFDEIKQALAGCKPGRCAPDCPYGDRIGCVQELHRDALAMVQQLEAQAPKWISVEERLPEKARDVLVSVEGMIDLAYYHHAVGWSCFTAKRDYNVTHWMPLPEPPKEDVHV